MFALLWDFFDSTTVHGFAYVHKRNHGLFRILWVNFQLLFRIISWAQFIKKNTIEVRVFKKLVIVKLLSIVLKEKSLSVFITMVFSITAVVYSIFIEHGKMGSFQL